MIWSFSQPEMSSSEQPHLKGGLEKRISLPVSCFIPPLPFFFFFLLPKVEFPLSMFHVGSKGRTYVLDLKLVRWEKRSRHGIYFWPRVVHYRHALTINPFSKAHVDYYDLSFFSLTEKNPHASASWDLLLNVVLTQMQSWFPWKLYGEVHFSHNSHSK